MGVAGHSNPFKIKRLPVGSLLKLLVSSCWKSRIDDGHDCKPAENHK